MSEKLTPDEFEKIRNSRIMRVKLAKSSPYWFFHIYFHDYIQFETANFQREMFANLTNEQIRHLVIVSFRGSAKSTIVTTVFPIWSVISGRRKFVIIASQTQPQAQQHLRNVRDHLESNELFRQDFGRLEFESGEWGLTALSIPKFKAKIMSASRGQNIRGWRHGSHRPDLIICDDVEDIDSVKTAESRNETFRWFNSEIMGIGGLDTQFVTVGNLLHEDSLVMRLKAGFAAGTRSGKYTEYPLVKCGKSIWPGMYPNVVAIKKRQGDFDHQTWMREFMLIILPDEDQIVTRTMIQSYDLVPPKIRRQSRHRYVGVDLAVSEKTTADYTAAVSLIAQDIGTDRIKIYVLPGPINKRMSFNQIIDMLIEINEDHPNTRFVIETVAAQDYVAQSVESQGLKVAGIKPTNGKRERLNIVADKIKRGTILFPQTGCELLIAQLTGFGVEKHDDLMDAFTIAVIEILNCARNKPAPAVFKKGNRMRSSSEGSIVRIRNQTGSITTFHDPHGW
jgi:predicted phage terminase large subunit-like protein